MIMGTDNKMCNDRNSMEFMHAVMTHMAPPNQMGTTSITPVVLSRGVLN